MLALTPSIGGYFFGELLSGLAREVAAADGRLVVVQTLEPDTLSGDIGEPGAVGDYELPVAWSVVDGVVSVLGAVGAPYLHRLRDRGIPVVLTARVDGFEAPVALPDNSGGTFAAVEHLVEHGHTRIGFVGNLAQADVRDRFDAYLEVLDSHGLVADPALVFIAHDNARAGGDRAARAVLAAVERPTALMVATDRNALGLLRTLATAGVSVPGDIAIIGFDNIEDGGLSSPTLSSVNQHFAGTGALAGRLVLAQIRGEAVPAAVFTPPSIGLAVRQSCGCATGAPDSDARASDRFSEHSPEVLRDELLDELTGTLLTGACLGDDPQRERVLAMVHELDVVLGSDDDVTPTELRALTSSLRDLTTRSDLRHRITTAVLEYVQRSSVTAVTDGDPRSTSIGPVRLTAALWQLQARSYLQRAEATESALEEQFKVDVGLLATSGSDPTALRWLDGTHVRAGVLALWEDGPSSPLRIIGAYDHTGTLPDLIGTRWATESFPSKLFIAATLAGDRGVCVVIPVRTRERDWGLLAVTGEMGSAPAREAYHHWAALLGATLEAEALQETVRKSALYDALTGLSNRRLFLDRLGGAVALWHRDKIPFAVLFLDLDGFKLINDSLGHPMGDRVLTAVGTRIEQALRTVDTGARFGGDEFAILLHDVQPDEVLVVAERVQASLAATLVLDGHEFSIQASLGIATSAVEYASAEDVLRDADTAMYRAKESEQGAVAFFDAAMHAQAVQQMRLHVEVQRALDEHQFVVHYQPIVNLGTGFTDRFEALVRWQHPERGLLPPDQFLATMQDAGLIVRLGHWIVDEVCRQLATWGPRVAGVNVNLSDREFWHRGLLPAVLSSLERHGLSPNRLTLEVTEDVLMRHPDRALEIMRALHRAGITIHIDAFGTGCSSLQTLRRFPIDAIKIDRSFISNLTTSGRSAELVGALVSLGRSLGLAVVAEGVETPEQLAFLREIGCATGQGYLFMPAVSGELAPGLLGHDLDGQASAGSGRDMK